MTAIDYRNANFSQIRDLLSGQRLLVLHAWRRFGPGTTRQIAHKAGIDILTFRPRTTELLQLGLIELVPDVPGADAHEGSYRALTDFQAEAQFNQRKEEARRQAQPELDFSTSAASASAGATS